MPRSIHQSKRRLKSAAYRCFYQYGPIVPIKVASQLRLDIRADASVKGVPPEHQTILQKRTQFLLQPHLSVLWCMALYPYRHPYHANFQDLTHRTPSSPLSSGRIIPVTPSTASAIVSSRVYNALNNVRRRHNYI